MARALVTGATGFIGRHLCRHLVAHGWDVTALHRTEASTDVLTELRRGGVETLPFLTYPEVNSLAHESAPDVVFHLAAHYARSHGSAEVESLVGANVTMGTHLLEGLTNSDCVIVNTVSYLQFRQNVAVPFSLYTATKQAFMELSQFYREERGLDIRHVVLYDNFGPQDSRDKLIAKIAKALHSNEFMQIGSPQQPLNVLYVEDLVSGLVAASRPGNPATMTVRADRNASVGTIVQMLEIAAGRELDKRFDTSRPTSDLVDQAGTWPLPTGWAATWKLSEGLAETYHSLDTN